MSTVIIGDSQLATVSGGTPSQGALHLLTAENEIAVHDFAVNGQLMSYLPGNAHLVGVGCDLYPAIAFCHGYFGIEATVIMLGGNDCKGNVALDDYLINYAYLARRALKLKPVVLLGHLFTPQWGEATQNELGLVQQDYRDTAEAVAMDIGCDFIPDTALMPHDPQYFEANGDHMLAEGHSLFKTNLCANMQALGYWL